METRVTVMGKTWIVPSNAVYGLVSWLNANAVELGNPKQEIREVRGNGPADPRQLIVE